MKQMDLLEFMMKLAFFGSEKCDAIYNRNFNVVNGGRVLYKAVTKENFQTKTNFSDQIIKLQLHNSYLVFMNLKKLSGDGNKKTTKTHQIKIPKKTQVPSPCKKLKKYWGKSLNHTRKI